MELTGCHYILLLPLFHLILLLILYLFSTYSPVLQLSIIPHYPTLLPTPMIILYFTCYIAHWTWHIVWWAFDMGYCMLDIKHWIFDIVYRKMDSLQYILDINIKHILLHIQLCICWIHCTYFWTFKKFNTNIYLLHLALVWMGMRPFKYISNIYWKYYTSEEFILKNNVVVQLIW